MYRGRKEQLLTDCLLMMIALDCDAIIVKTHISSCTHLLESDDDAFCRRRRYGMLVGSAVGSSSSSTVSPAAKTPRNVGQPKTPPRDVAIWPVVDRTITLHNL